MKTRFFNKIADYFISIDRGVFLVLIGMLYATIFFCSFVMGYKTVDLYGRILCSSVFVFPLLFPINDSITELLGAKISYLMIIAIVICEFMFSFITHALAVLPSPSHWQGQEIYPILTTGFIHIAIADSISLAIGFFANTYVLNKWGIKWFGTGFFRRSLGATAVGELLFTISTNIITFHILSTENLMDTANIIISDYILKMVYSFIICIPNAYLVSLVKKHIQKEGTNNELNIIPFNQIRVKYRT
ncbi:VUT family protein [Fluoribacter gormanii]|uniref:VUT family protein n=1 Tax=Fluoribacter gormanii TaxID=464 RepID=UPI002242FDE8|nr:VUT family protein [Fluoribacter gormanii]MCW8469901.1 VUT family protein [Fluoribacter gormanii]